MKLSIEIDDVSDKIACVRAVRQMFTAFADQHGLEEAVHIWRQNHDLNIDRAKEFFQAEREFTKAIYSLTPKERLLVLEYSDANQSKRGLGKALAAKSGAKDTSLIRQIRRVFSEHPEECRIISKAPMEWRARAWRFVDMKMPREFKRMTKPRA